MHRRASTQLTGLLVAAVLVVGAWPGAQARIHSLSGNARFQIGNGIPVPVGFSPESPVPVGKVLAISGATIRQHGVHAATSPAVVVIDPTQLSHPGTPPFNLLIFGTPQPLQLNTAISLRFPKSKISFRAGGRTGPDTVTFCGQPGSTVTASHNPACAGGTGGTGLLRYTRTSNQFGGPARIAVGGAANGALAGGSPPPCAGGPGCVIAFFNATPVEIGAVGGPFGFTVMTSAPAPNPGAFFGTVGVFGTVLNLLTPLAPGLPNAGTGWGGPWTTGMVTASNPSAGPPQKFTITGADGRAAPSGGGSLSLVAGGFSHRMISGPSANRGWLNLSVGPVVSKIPTMPLRAVVALVCLMALLGGTMLRRRNRTARGT